MKGIGKSLHTSFLSHILDILKRNVLQLYYNIIIINIFIRETRQIWPDMCKYNVANYCAVFVQIMYVGFVTNRDSESLCTLSKET